MAIQYKNRPPFCDFLARYQSAYSPRWTKSQLLSQRVGLGRFDEWLKATEQDLRHLNWQKLMELHRFVAAQGISIGACRRTVHVAKHALRWGIEKGELPQKLTDIYTYTYKKNTWNVELPALSQEFLNELEPTRPGSFRAHRHSHRVFHAFLSEKNLTYRRIRTEHMVAFMKFIGNKGFVLHTRASMAWHIRAYLRRLYKMKKISRHPDDLFPTHLAPKNQIGLPRPLDPEIDHRLQELLQNTEDIYYKAILLLRRTGIRISELRQLEFECIQTDHKGRCALIVPPIKLGIERRVPLDPDTVLLVRKIQNMSIKNYSKKSRPKVLLIGEQGTPPRYERFSAAMTEICARLGVKKWINLHALRHTYATSMLNAGLTITSLKEILGHKAINMSLIYAKVSPEKIHAEYSQALKRMSDQQIPQILISKPGGPETAFADLGSAITKAMDSCGDTKKEKRLRSLKNRLAKIKMELLKTI